METQKIVGRDALRNFLSLSVSLKHSNFGTLDTHLKIHPHLAPKFVLDGKTLTYTTVFMGTPLKVALTRKTSAALSIRVERQEKDNLLTDHSILHNQVAIEVFSRFVVTGIPNKNFHHILKTGRC